MATLTRKVMALCALEKVDERRDQDRTPSGLPCACSLITMQQRPPFWPAKVRDISAGGIGLVIGRAVQPGTFLAIHFNSGIDKPLRAKVVHSTHCRLEEGWVVGCELSQGLSDDEIQSLI